MVLSFGLGIGATLVIPFERPVRIIRLVFGTPAAVPAGDIVFDFDKFSNYPAEPLAKYARIRVPLQNTFQLDCNEECSSLVASAIADNALITVFYEYI